MASVRYNRTIHDDGLLNALLGVPSTGVACGRRLPSSRTNSVDLIGSASCEQRVALKSTKKARHESFDQPINAANFDNNLTTTPVDIRGQGGTQRTIRRIQYAVRLHSSVGRAADS